MSYGLSISFEDQASSGIQQLAVGLQKEKRDKVLGRASVSFTREHFFELDSSRANALGGRRTHFYGQAASGTFFELTGDGLTVNTRQVGVMQRLKGGPIFPRKDWLTIPAVPEAHGKRAREFNDLRFQMLRPGLAALIKKGKGKQPVVYWLKRSVHQDPDESVLPTQPAFEAHLKEELEAYIETLQERNRQ